MSIKVIITVDPNACADGLKFARTYQIDRSYKIIDELLFLNTGSLKVAEMIRVISGWL